MRALRPYQAESVAAIEHEWQAQRSTLLVLATGCGKTFTAAEVIRRRRPAGMVLWLAHREELLYQAKEAIKGHTGLTVGVEKAEQRAEIVGLWGARVDVVVASVQTLASAKRRTRFDPSLFGTVIVDEAHHATAKTYRDILGHFPDAKVLGLTATPDRGDAVGLGAIFETCAYRYEIRRAIREGYLCPITQRAIECASLDLRDVKVTAGDLNQGDLERAMRVDEVLHQISAPLVREAGTRPTIVFTVSVAQARALEDVLAGYTSAGIRMVDGGTPTELRARYLAEFARGDVQFMLNCGVLTEGFDAPRTACIAVARPTKSRALYTQMIGRGTRLFQGKSDCLVLDFVGNSGRHTLVTPLDVLAGRPIPEDVQQKARELAEQGMPSDEALDEAERLKAEKLEAERLRREAAERKVQAEVAYRAKQVDPFGCIDESDRSGPRATDSQVAYLKNLGVEFPHVPSRKEASRMLDEISARRRKGLCTYKQARALVKRGLSPDLSFDDARAAMDALSASGWVVTTSIRARFGAQSETAE